MSAHRDRWPRENEWRDQRDALARGIARGLFASWNMLPAQAPERFERTVQAVLAGMAAESMGLIADLATVTTEAGEGS